MIALVIQYFLCVLPIVKIWHFSGKFDQHLSLYCGSVKPKFKTGPGYRFLWESCELQFPKFTDNFGTVSSNINTFKSSSNFDPIEITYRTMACSVCLKPVSIETWCIKLHTPWHFTVPVYAGRWTSAHYCLKIYMFWCRLHFRIKIWGCLHYKSWTFRPT